MSRTRSPGGAEGRVAPAVAEKRPQRAAFRPVRTIHAYERIVEQIEEAILMGRIAPYDRLPSERELMSHFQVGRSTVREALRVLQSKGLVRSRPGDPNGPIVLPFSTEPLRDSMYALARVEHLTLRELLQFRMIVEGSAFGLAAIHRTAGELAALEDALGEMEAAVEAGEDAFTSADFAFHDLIAEAARNKLLALAGSVVRDIIRALVRSKLAEAPDSAGQMRESCRRHRAVLAAVRAGDAERASALARRNLFDYYALHLSPEDRAAVAALLGHRG